jgi:hypothetical protein
MGRKRSQYYIDPVELKEEIRKFQESENDEQMSDKLGEMLIKLATRFASRPNFYRYSYKEDFIADAILRMVQQIHKINLDHPKCNPFTYLTMTCYHVFIAKITKEKKFTDTKDALTDRYYDMFEVNEGLNLKKKNEDK